MNFHKLVIGLLGFIFIESATAHAAPLQIRLTGDPETLDWNLAHTMIEGYLLNSLMEGLVAYEYGGLKVVPALAEKWTQSSDGKTYTFYLRKNVRWSDGKPLRAADFAASWKRLLSPVTAASYGDFLHDIENAEEFHLGKISNFSQVGIRALDDHTFQVRLKRRVPYWIYIPTFWCTFPIREDVIAQHSGAWARPGRMVTIGPFTLDSYEVDQQIVLKKNPNYYQASKIKFDAIHAKILRNETDAIARFKEGKLDLVHDLSTGSVQTLGKSLGSMGRVHQFPYLKTTYLGFKVKKYPLSDVRVRRAIAMAIDRNKLQREINPTFKPATSFVPPPLIGYDSKIGIPFDPIRARKELAVAGWNVSNPLTVELLTSNWDKFLMVAQFLEKEISKNLGITVSVQPFENKVFRAQLDLNAYPLFMGNWGADYPDPDNVLGIFASGSGNNRFQWSNPVFDGLISRAKVVSNTRARADLYLDAQKLLLEKDIAVVPLFYETNQILVSSRVKNFKVNPMNVLDLRPVEQGK